MSRIKHPCLSVTVKKKISKEVDDKIWSKAQIVQKYGILKYIVSINLKPWENIFGEMLKVQPFAKNFSESKHPNSEMSEFNFVLNDIYIYESLLYFNWWKCASWKITPFFVNKLNINDFKLLDDWLQKVKILDRGWVLNCVMEIE